LSIANQVILANRSISCSAWDVMFPWCCTQVYLTWYL